LTLFLYRSAFIKKKNNLLVSYIVILPQNVLGIIQSEFVIFLLQIPLREFFVINFKRPYDLIFKATLQLT